MSDEAGSDVNEGVVQTDTELGIVISADGFEGSTLEAWSTGGWLGGPYTVLLQFTRAHPPRRRLRHRERLSPLR